MDIRIVIKNKLGEFKSSLIRLNEEEYSNLIELSKNFYLSGGYEMQLDSGFIVIPPDIVKESILIIEKNETN